MKAIKIEYLDYAPKDTEQFKAWCKKQGFHYTGTIRRAWCDEMSTYLRDSAGVATLENGSRVLFDDDDIINVPTKSKAGTSPLQIMLAEMMTRLEMADDQDWFWYTNAQGEKTKMYCGDDTEIAKLSQLLPE